ncbi:hypothetical protein KAR91_77425 [Candidatus Pacearchaeota archaeon]|nr:hypothetical protein [Candidatus Pacearchaeota archaeon]
MASFIDKNGERQQIELSPEMYRAAKDANHTFRQYINRKYETTLESKADTFTQFCASEGLIFTHDKEMGLRSSTLKNIFDGAVNMEAAGVIREVSPVGSRVLFPAALLEYVENKLSVDRESMPSVFERMIAVDTTVANARVEQPQINFSSKKDGPEDKLSQPVGQLALPANMVSITASERTFKIPTNALGMTISDEALNSTTLDLVGMALTRQAEIERNARSGDAIEAMLNGDVDTGADSSNNIAVPGVNADVYDSTITLDGELTQKAWVKWLYANLLIRRLDWIVCDVDTALIIEGRTNKPTTATDDPTSDRIDTLFTIQYPNLVENVNMFIVDDSITWPANGILGLDSRYAIGRITNSEAEYSAVERFALRKGEGLRFDFGEIYYKPFKNEPFARLDLINT